MGSPAPARILLVDDHPIVRMALKQLLSRETDFAVCGEAASMDEAMLAVRSLKPDLVVMDLSLGGAGGLELIRRLNNLDAGLPVLVFTLYDEATFAEMAFAAGARGYVTKQES